MATQVPISVLETVETQWIDRRKAQQLPVKGSRYARDEVEFFVGAIAALMALETPYETPPRWTMPIMTGRRIVEVNRFK